MSWKKVRSPRDLPTTGGTRAAVYFGAVAWVYYNPSTKRWYPISGWRRQIGQPWDSVTAYFDLPNPPK